MTTNPYTLLIEMQLDGDYIKQEAAVAFAKEYARLEIERIKQTGTNTLVMGRSEQLAAFMRWYWKEIDGKPYEISAEEVVSQFGG